MVVEMTAAAGAMEWYKRIYYAVFFPHAYFPAVRIMREKLRLEREKEQNLHSESKEKRPG
jgi:hypothetical protein